jgi:hypothetical protein
MKIAKKMYSILCDDVREEKGNKLSLIGIYSKSIFFNKVPAIYPKICLALFFEGIKEPLPELKVVLKFPESEDEIIMLKAPSKAPLNDDVKLVLVKSPFKVMAVGKAKFQVYFGDARRPSLIHDLDIKVIKKKGS